MNVHTLREELIKKASHRDPGNASDFDGSGGKANGKTTIDDLLAGASPTRSMRTHGPGWRSQRRRNCLGTWSRQGRGRSWSG